MEIDDEGLRLWTLTGYDRGYAVRNLSVLEHSLTIRAGTGYAAAIREQLLAAGIKTCTIADTAEVLPTDHAWETGTTRYRVIEDLLAEINYRSLYFDGKLYATVRDLTANCVVLNTALFEQYNIPLPSADWTMD